MSMKDRLNKLDPEDPCGGVPFVQVFEFDSAEELEEIKRNMPPLKLDPSDPIGYRLVLFMPRSKPKDS